MTLWENPQLHSGAISVSNPFYETVSHDHHSTNDLTFIKGEAECTDDTVGAAECAGDAKHVSTTTL